MTPAKVPKSGPSVMGAVAVTAPITRSGQRLRRTRRSKLEGLLFASPAWLVLAPVILLPLFLSVYQSTTTENLISVGAARQIGLKNYFDEVISSPDFWRSLMVTVTIMVASLIVQIPIGLGLALALVKPFRGRGAVQAGIVVPMLLTPVAIGLMWKFLANPDLGVIRWVASAVDPSARPNLFGSAAGSLGLIVAVNSWINIPWVTIMLLAGLVGIPKELHESAAIDGAGRIQSLVHVTIPVLMPVLAVTCAIRAVADYRMFDIVWALTKGGPGDATRNLSMLDYQQSLWRSSHSQVISCSRG
jgi:multiple sugar transport system permease protein